MGIIVVAMPRESDAVHVKEMILGGGFYSEFGIVSRGAEVLEIVQNQPVDMIICMPRFSDMGYQEMVSCLPAGITVVLMTKNDALVPFSSCVVKLLMPFRSEELLGILRQALPEYGRRPKKKPLRSLKDQLLIDDAKKLLMEKKGLTEPEAFRYLQKNSMDMGRTMPETAAMILSLYSE